MCWLLITSSLTIIQVLLIGAKVTEVYPVIYLFYIPWEFLAPLCFSAFISSYLDRMWVFNSYRKYLSLPFYTFFLIYTIQKTNALLDYTLYSREISLLINNEWIENCAVLFAFANGIWNYKMIKSYERSLSGVPHKEVVQKTQWLRVMYTILICLSIVWVLVIIYLKISAYHRSMIVYYPLWLLYLIFYFIFIYMAEDHLRNKIALETKTQENLESVITHFNKEGLNRIFESEELESALSSTYEVTRILSYFATSLFDKYSEEDVLWDVVKNGISMLDLEDCVIYMLDSDKKVLIQKAAYGNKAAGSRKVLSPIEIKIGEGIVGTVAITKKWECVDDVSKDDRYVLDDIKRQSELAVPILMKQEVLGVLDAEHSQKNFFDRRYIFIFQLIAKLTATKLKQIEKKGALTITNDNGYFKELSYLMESKKIFKDPDLSLTSISERLNISVTYLSQLINKLTGTNFSDYINGYRVKETQKLLGHYTYNSYSILSIGLEAGFNSKSAFYTAFKKHTGTTPSQYRAKAPFMS